MTMSMAASHAASKRLKDAIFGASAACAAAAKEHGADAVTNATIGTMLDDSGKLATMPTMERVFREMSVADFAAYAPISGLPAFLDAAIDLTFGGQLPEAYTAAVATAGGTGAVHHAVANYAERGEYVLTSDWFWGTYNVICNETGKKLTNFRLVNEQGGFDIKDFTAKVTELFAKQESLLVIINSPANNPTGFSLSDAEWDEVIEVAKSFAAKGKKLTLLVDIAYIDFAGEKHATRAFMQKFAQLPENVLVLFAYSMSKGFTLYGQRTGALVAMSSSKDVIDEFKEINKYTSRATWSNINRGAQTVLLRIQQDPATLAQFEQERDDFYKMIQKRAHIFMDEAEACGLDALPYKGGFFIAVPAHDPQAVCNELHKDLVFAVPLKLGVRVAACSVSTAKMKGLAAKVKRAWDAVEK